MNDAAVKTVKERIVTLLARVNHHHDLIKKDRENIQKSKKQIAIAKEEIDDLKEFLDACEHYGKN